MKAKVYDAAKPGQPHVMRWRVPDATRPRGFAQHDKSFDTAREMYRAIEEMQARIDAGEFDAKPYSFGEAAYHWLATRELKPITRTTYGQVIKYTLTGYLDMPLAEVAMMRREMQELIDEQTRGRTIRAIVEGTCKLAQAEGMIATHRLGMMELKREVKRVRELIPLTAGQLNAILVSVPEKYRLAILLMRGCGMRVGEAFALETDAIHDGYLEVTRSTSCGWDGTPKQRYEGFVARRVPIPHWLTPELESHIERFAKDGVLFPAETARANKSRYLNYSGFTRALKPAARDAGLPEDSENFRDNFTSHQFRKHWATQFRAEASDLGVTMDDVEQWIGHKDLTRDNYSFQGADAIERGRKLSDPRYTATSVS